MQWCSSSIIPYNTGMASLLLPTIINNSQSIKPWYLVSRGEQYYIFTNNSKIIWDKDKVTLTNYFVNYSNTTIDSYTIPLISTEMKSYPPTTKFKILVSKDEMLPINKKIEFVRRDSWSEDTEYNIKTHEWIRKEFKAGDLYREIYMVLSIWDLSIVNLKSKKPTKKTLTIKEFFDIKANKRLCCELDEILLNTTEDNFEVIDNFSNK